MFRRTRDWNVATGDTQQVAQSAHEETFRYSPDGDSRVRRLVLQQLFPYGVTDDDPDVQSIELGDLLMLEGQLASDFWKREKRWIEHNLTVEEILSLRQSRADHGMGTTFDQPLVDRPHGYCVLAGHSRSSLTLAWKLVDRGIEVSRTAMDRHFCYLRGLKAGNPFYDAWVPELEHKRLAYAVLLKHNRPAAAKDFMELWGEVPPNLGGEYDYLEYTQAANRIARAYRDRDTVDRALDQAISACHSMISRTLEFQSLFLDLELDLPARHHGYYQLSVILAKQRQWNEVITLCRQAIGEGWPGDWDTRIARAEQRLARSK